MKRSPAVPSASLPALPTPPTAFPAPRRVSAAAALGVDGCRQGVGRTALRPLPGSHLVALPDPVLDAAEHLLDAVAEPGQSEGRAGGAVAAGAPAVDDDRDRRIEDLPRVLRI